MTTTTSELRQPSGAFAPDTNSTANYTDLGRLLSLMTGDEKHDASALSTLDSLWVLYHRVMNTAELGMHDAARDRFLMSKGHGPMAYYAVLASAGLLAEDLLPGLGSLDSPLGHHPDATIAPGVEIASGSLGHGLGIGVGLRLGLDLQGNAARVFVLLGDAELDEGSNAEAIAVAARRGLGGLSAVVIDNSSATLRWPGGIAARFAVEGWSTADVDGHDHDALQRAFEAATPTAPHVVIARTESKE